MPWFSTCLVFKVENQTQIEHTFYEDVWMIIQSEYEVKACEKALDEGHKRSEIFLNVHSESISWKFIGCKTLKEITLEDVVVIHSDTKMQAGAINHVPINAHQTA